MHRGHNFCIFPTNKHHFHSILIKNALFESHHHDETLDNSKETGFETELHLSSTLKNGLDVHYSYSDGSEKTTILLLKSLSIKREFMMTPKPMSRV